MHDTNTRLKTNPIQLALWLSACAILGWVDRASAQELTCPDYQLISWSINATNFTLERKLDLGASTWEVVPGVTNNQAVISATNAAAFYRLHGQ